MLCNASLSLPFTIFFHCFSFPEGPLRIFEFDVVAGKLTKTSRSYI